MLALLGKLIALILTPIILIAGMAITVALHAVLASFVGTSALAAIITTVLSLGCFIAVVWFCYYWTKTSGLYLFELS